MTRRRAVATAVASALALLIAPACGGGGGGGGDEAASTTSAPASTTSAPTVPDREPTTLRVPEDHRTIQQAVDASVPGDLILIGPGTYHESVRVATEGIVIRGLDRNAVILDGQDDADDGITVNADRVAVENLTIRHYRFNGLLFVPRSYDGSIDVLEGYRASYITAYDNGLYGIYAFRARGGVIEDSYASGHPDSGFYVGECDPCDAVVQRVVAEHNVVGFQGTNASTNLLVVESTWQFNRVGIQPNSDTSEGEAPAHDATIVGNRVLDNDDPETPPTETGDFGYGIALGGTSRTVVERNLVAGNGNAGITLLGVNDGFVAEGSRIAGNVLRENGVDLEYLSPTGEILGNCYEANAFTSSVPDAIEAALPCPGGTGAVAAGVATQRLPVPAGRPYTDIAAPPPQPSMPDAATAPARPADGMPTIDLAAIAVPSA